MRSNRKNKEQAGAGWLYADVLLGLLLIFLAAADRNKPLDPDNPDAIRETTYINHHFYEDLYTTVKSSLEIFAFLKKTNVLAENKRDINKYVNYQTLNGVVLPYTMMGDEGEDNVHTLDTKELRCIQNHQNFIEKSKEYDESVGRA